MPFCPNLSCLVAKEACLRINLAQIMCEPFSFGNVSNSGVVDDRSEECWWSSFCSAPLQQPPLHEYEMIMTLCVFIWEYIRSRGKLNRKTNMSRWQFCLCGSMTFFLRLMSTWWSFSHASFKSQNFGGLFQDSCFSFLSTDWGWCQPQNLFALMCKQCRKVTQKFHHLRQLLIQEKESYFQFSGSAKKKH